MEPEGALLLEIKEPQNTFKKLNSNVVSVLSFSTAYYCILSGNYLASHL